MKVGFIGLGRMGQAIAKRILDAGHELAVHNRTPGKTDALVSAGARPATSVAAACEARDVVVTMLADDPALREVASGPGGLVARLPAGSIHVAMGTHGVEVVRALAAEHAAAGQTLVAAPVLGRPEAAAAGQLGIIAAGPADALATCAPLFGAIGRRTFEAGAKPESATSIKLANGFVLGCAIEAMGEAFSLVRRYGVEPQVLYEVMTDGLFAAPAYKIYGRIIVDRSYDNVGFTARLGLKDFKLVLEAGEAARVPLSGANTVRDRLLCAIARGDGDRDWAVIAREQARACGLE
jgi:3-hydroxyisobutyrate dehydrogenase-like beta-hydroxyacid dehydrogenase